MLGKYFVQDRACHQDDVALGNERSGLLRRTVAIMTSSSFSYCARIHTSSDEAHQVLWQCSNALELVGVLVE